MPSSRRDLTDAQWEILDCLIPEPTRRKDGRGRPWRGRREVLNGVLYILRTGAAWADLPERYPPYQTCHRRFQQWVRSGVMRGVLEALAEDLRSHGGFTPHEVTLVQQALAEIFAEEPIQRLIGDNAYDSDRLDLELAETGVEMIAPHRSNRTRLTQDGRPLRLYRRRWKIERLFAWLQNFRRLATRYEHSLDNFTGMVHLACALILLRHL
jgi:transposase